MATSNVRQPGMRIFNPEDDPSTAGMSPKELIAYDEAHEIHHLRSRLRPIWDDSTVIVSIKGRPRSARSQTPGGAYGIYVGPESCYNANGLLPYITPHFERRYEMEALAKALEVIRNIVVHNTDISRILVITDSDFLSSTLSGIRPVIMDNGNQIPHLESLKQLHEGLCEIERSDRMIQFWNTDSLAGEAYKLAMQAT